MDNNTEKLLTGLLKSEEDAVKEYNLSLTSCTSPPTHEALLDLLCDQHQICLDVKTELQKRGLIKPEAASQLDLKRVLNTFPPL